MMTLNLGFCECGAPLADGGTVGLYCTRGIECPEAKKILRTFVRDTRTLLARELLDQCVAYHDAMDVLFALLIMEAGNDKPHPFYPSKCGKPWKTMQDGRALIERAQTTLFITASRVSPKAT